MQVGQRFTDRKTELVGVGLPFKHQRNNVNRRLRLDFMLGRAWRALQYRKRFDVNVNGRRGL
jgi:hypothetical protein